MNSNNDIKNMYCIEIVKKIELLKQYTNPKFSYQRERVRERVHTLENYTSLTSYIHARTEATLLYTPGKLTSAQSPVRHETTPINVFS